MLKFHLCRSELAFANKNDVLANNFVWEAPYPGAGPETPAWEKTPASVGQGADSALDDKNREHNVLAGEYQFPDYARRPAARSSKLWMKTAAGHWGIQQQPRTGLWVGSPSKMLPPDGDYPGGSTGIPEDGYLAYETGWGEQPYHGMTAPMQEAGIMQKVFVPVQLMGSKRGQTLSIMDPGEQPEPFNDWVR